MAGSPVPMAESPVVLLHADRALLTRASRTGRHHHPFWQLDHCAHGTIAAWLPLPGRELVLRRGQGVLLPPGVAHEFRYTAGSGYVSWKFRWSGPAGSGPAGGGAIVLDRQPGWRGLAAALAEGPPAAALAPLLAGAVRLAGVIDAPVSAVDLLGTVTSLLAQHPGRAWSVAGLARTLRLSPGHLSARFHAEHGLALKQWLDAQRADGVARLLAASDLPLAALAPRCAFADAFALSRFFRRVTGESPATYRQRLADK